VRRRGRSLGPGRGDGGRWEFELSSLFRLDEDGRELLHFFLGRDRGQSATSGVVVGHCGIIHVGAREVVDVGACGGSKRSVGCTSTE